MAFSIKRWIQGTVGKAKIEEVDCRGLFEAAQNYRIRELAFWSCVNLIANALGRCEFRTYKGGKEIREREYYLWNVEPNINQNSTVFLHKLVAKLYEDNETLIISPGILNNIPSLVVADNWEAPLYFPDKPNEYRNVVAGERIYNGPLYEKDVIHLKLNYCNIQPVIKGIYDSYVKLVSAAMNNYTWTNGQHWKVRVSQMASGQEGWAEQFQKMLEAQIKPFLTSGSAILPELDGYSYENVGKSFENSRDASHIRTLVNDIFDFTANAFLIPPVLLRGQVEGTEDAVQRFLTNCVDPLADQMSEEISRKHITLDDQTSEERKLGGYLLWKQGRYFRVDTSAIQHFNLFGNAASVEKLIGSGYSYNDVQRAAGGPEINEPWANEHFLTRNFAKAQDLLSGKTEGDETT